MVEVIATIGQSSNAMLSRRKRAATQRAYVQGIDPEEMIATVRMRRAPVISAGAGLRL